MDLNRIKLSTILIPIGALGMIFFLISTFVPVLHLKSSFSVAISFIGFIFFITGVIVWLFESTGKKPFEVSEEKKPFEIPDKSKNIRQIGLIIGIICFLILGYIIYSVSKISG